MGAAGPRVLLVHMRCCPSLQGLVAAKFITGLSRVKCVCFAVAFFLPFILCSSE